MKTTHFYKCLLTVLVLAIFSNSPLTAQSDEGYRSADEARGLAVGDTVQDFSATELNLDNFKLSKALENGPVVLLFYRGQWCPVCNRHLSALQDSLDLITQKGAQLIAVSPEKPEYGAKMAEKTGARFTLLYDEDYAIAKAFDVLFLPDAATRSAYNTKLNAQLNNAHSDDSQRLPIPATFIIGQDGTILWRHFDPDYKKRASVKEITKALESNGYE